MKRRFLSILMALCLALSLLPTAAFAAEGDEGGNEATFGDVEYATLEAAVAEANKASLSGAPTIRLLKDVELEATLEIATSVILDGAGHSISGTDGNKECLIHVTGAADRFTVQDCIFLPGVGGNFGDGSKHGYLHIEAPVVTVSGCTFGSADGTGVPFIYNALEFTQSTETPLESATISGNTFYGGQLSHNCINLYSFAEDAKVDISGNKYLEIDWTTTNPIRISNYTSADVTVNITGDTLQYSSGVSGNNTAWEGLIILQDPSEENDPDDDFTKVTLNVTDLNAPADSQRLFYVYADHKGGILTDTNQPVVTGDESLGRFFDAKVGDTFYATLADAIEAADAGAKVTLLDDVDNGEGIVIQDKTVTIDFDGHTYTVTRKLAGSSGTQTQCFQLLQGSVVTLKNGAIAAKNSDIRMMIQNYSDLTLDSMTLNATVHSNENNVSTVVSNNCGTVQVLGSTTLTAKSENDIAFDVSYWPSSYPDGTNVVVDTTGTITGRIDLGLYGRSSSNPNTTEDPIPLPSKSHVTIKNVDHKGIFTTTNGITGWVTGLTNEAAAKVFADMCEITGGTFSDKSAEDYLSTGLTLKDLSEGAAGAGPWQVTAADGMSAAAEKEGETVSAEVGGNFNTSGENGEGVDTENATVSINVTTGAADNTITDVTVTIANASLTSVAAAETVSAVKIATDAGTVTLDKAAWDTIADNADGSSVTLTVSKNDEASMGGWTVSAVDADGNPVFSAEDESRKGSVTISVKHSAALDENETILVYYIGEDGQLEALETTYNTEDKTLTWTVDHLSDFVGVTIGPDDEAVWLESTEMKAGTLAEALDALDDVGGAIDLIRSAELTSASYTISKNITIQKSDHPYETDPAITATVADGNETIAFTIVNDGGLTLNGVKMTINGNGDGTQGKAGVTGGTGFNMQTSSALTLENRASLVMNDLTRGLVATGTPTPIEAAVTVDGSTLTAENIGGNFSNGGQWTIKNGATVTIKQCVNNGLSANTVTVDKAELTIEDVGYRGIIINDSNGALKIQNNARVSVTNTCNTTDSNATSIYKDKVAVQLAANTNPVDFTLDKTSSLNLGGDNIKVNTESGATNSIDGSINGTVLVNEDSDSFVVTYKNSNGTQVGTTVVDATGGEATVTMPAAPAAPGSDYTFAGWQDGAGELHAADENVTIRASATFTAVWNYTGGGSGSSGGTRYSVTAEDTTHGEIRVSPSRASRGQTVTITVDPDEGYELDELVVLDSDGDEIDVKRVNSTRYTFEMPRGAVTVEASFARETVETTFDDVGTDYWAYDEIEWAYDSGYMNGTSASTFAPGSSISRQQVWMILARMSGADPASMAEARQWAMENDISDGTNPGSAVTRQQLAALLFRFAQSNGYDDGGRKALTSFPDAGSVSAYAVEPLQWATAGGIIGGTSAGTLNPTGSATRAQFAVMLYRFWNNV